VVLVAGVRVRCVLAAPASRRGETNSRNSRVMAAIMSSPPANSASANCQPIRIHRTSPSSHTRFVEANWNASALAAEAPFWNSDLAIATAA
jgi:hypothetical protein